MIAELLDGLASLPPAAVTAVAGVLVFGECTLGLGFIAPGETGLFVLGTTATAPDRFGTVDPAGSLAAQRKYVAAFFDLHLRGRSTTVFDRAAHPVVELIP
ncbi:hypothetical protein [Amycolatopsis sp. Poz14]|uniref:hypothetical protein n=1 Tax=Amycolatopsis sp. Poz14 TaxID=1447705 RepID=UPI001EE93937|nr:hypothetical protein [Amycolatopsis sp. Poz14]